MMQTKRSGRAGIVVIVVGAALAPAGCGLIDPTELAVVRLSMGCGVDRAAVETALAFVVANREFGATGTGNIASLLDAIPELEVIANDADCLDAFLDAVESLD